MQVGNTAESKVTSKKRISAKRAFYSLWFDGSAVSKSRRIESSFVPFEKQTFFFVRVARAFKRFAPYTKRRCKSCSEKKRDNFGAMAKRNSKTIESSNITGVQRGMKNFVQTSWNTPRPEPCFVRSYYPTTERKNNVVSRRNWTGIITLRPRRIWNYYPATVISWLRRKRRYKRRQIVSLLVRIKNLQAFSAFQLVSWNLFFFSFLPFLFFSFFSLRTIIFTLAIYQKVNEHFSRPRLTNHIELSI